MARQRWLHLVFGVIWIGVGIVGFVWPHITIYIIAILIGWAFLVLGIFDIITSVRFHHLPYWWAYLVRGVIAVALGFLCLRHPPVHHHGPGDLHGDLVHRVRHRARMIGAFSARHATTFSRPKQDALSNEAVRLVSFSVSSGPVRGARPRTRRRGRRPQ